MMINTTITIAPINRLMGLFTFVSSFSFTRFPKRARTYIQVHSAILPSLAPLPNRLGHHKAGAPIKEPGSFLCPLSSRESPMPEVWFPGSTPLGRWVNRGTSSLSSFLDCEGIPRRAALVGAKSYFAAQRPRPQPTKEMATEVKEEVSAGQS